mmetsp:Transcript_2204/g.5155  ORF Transcript_2204/g.5155 Transcript_2204/m.5155 type:complete len:103 (+) Transcript_2204:1-309(+)
MRHNHVMESLELQFGLSDCPGFLCTEFYTGCNYIRLWRVMQEENAAVPWHEAFHALLNGRVESKWRSGSRYGHHGADTLKSFQLSMAFVLLRHRPDIVRKDR